MEPYIKDYAPLLHPVDHQVDNPSNQRADIVLISTSLPNPGAVTLIDVTQLELPQFFVHGRSTISTTVPLTSVVMQSDLRSLLSRGMPVSSFPCYNNRSPQAWLTVQQHSQNIISCCSNCTCQVCHHCKRPPKAGYGPLSSLHQLYHLHSVSPYLLYMCVMML